LNNLAFNNITGASKNKCAKNVKFKLQFFHGRAFSKDNLKISQLLRSYYTRFDFVPSMLVFQPTLGLSKFTYLGVRLRH
jgi:hypothetical protein